jgi:hypothetical protein
MATKVNQKADLKPILDFSLIGTYKLQKSTLHPTSTQTSTEPDYNLVICRRRKPTKNKPPRYLMLYKGDEAMYLSSIYLQEYVGHPCLDNYIFEYDKKYYQLGINNCSNEVGIKFHNSY